MYIGRDMSELLMTRKDDWREDELAYFHNALSQIAPYLNIEGTTILREINKEIERRGGLNKTEADYQHGTQIIYD